MTRVRDEAPDAVDALQRCLAGEHEAVWAYALIGSVVAGIDPGGATYERARDAYDDHQRQRDRLVRRITTLGQDPVVAEVGYATPEPVRDERSAIRLARHVETTLSQTYASAVARSVAGNRSVAADGLTACTLRAQGWGSAPEALPGL